MASIHPVGAHVLIADNDPDDQRPLIQLCSAAGLRVSIALDGVQAYQRALAANPDVVLMGVNLPMLDGFDACRLLKSDPATASIPVLFQSDEADLAQRLYGLRNGGVDFLLKSCDPEEVLARLQLHLDRAAPSPAKPDWPALRGRDEVLVRAAQQYLAACLRHPPTLRELADHVGCGEKRLMRAFRTYAGMTVFEFVREERMRAAQRLLSQTALPVSAIAEELGFSSGANFATAFRAKTGMTPGAFRDAARDGDTATCQESEPAETSRNSGPIHQRTVAYPCLA